MAVQTAEILSLLHSDYKQAFRILYKSYHGMVAHLVKSNSGNKQDADDLFQDVLVALFEQSRQPNFKIDCSIKTYIYSIARNLWLKELRSRKKQDKLKDYEQYRTLVLDDGVDLKSQQLNKAQAAMKKLGDKCQKILIGYYYKQQKMEVIAAELGYTNAANAKNQKYKCMQHLKKLVAAS